MKNSVRIAALASSFAALLSLTTAVSAQNDAARTIYRSAASIPTNIQGVRTYPAPPEGFNAMNASDEELATYGFPPRPDKAAHPETFAHWSHAMLSAKHRMNGELRAHPEIKTGPAILSKSKVKSEAVEAIQGSATPLTFNSTNWSGVANTNTLTKWNSKSSVGIVASEFNVPVVQQAFDVCDGGYDWEVSWNGIDGAKNGDVLQGGSSSQAYCANNKPQQFYYAWVEWYPSYPILEVFGVNPGDDMFVETYDLDGGCNPGNVFVEDETTLAYGTYTLDYKTGPCLVGNSAEFIVERPGGGNGLYPLANYIWDFALSWGYTLKGTYLTPGSTAASTYIFNMVDDNGDQVISVPTVEGKTSLFFYDTGCAYTGGCVR
jgi:hypothetical protein